MEFGLGSHGAGCRPWFDCNYSSWWYPLPELASAAATLHELTHHWPMTHREKALRKHYLDEHSWAGRRPGTRCIYDPHPLQDKRTS